MGKPAARLGDMAGHGGTVTVGCPTVLIGGQPAACVGDMHVCPMVNPGVPPPPHVGGPASLGSTGVLIGGRPAARMGDMVTCAGPPDTIAAGCPTVLIGEAGGGGGGGGGGAGAGFGGASGALAAASNMSVVVATAKAEPPESTTPETHWIEFQFVDKAGNPVGGVPFEFTGPDGKKDSGVLPSGGKIRREPVPAGNATVKIFSVSNAQWSVEEARTEDKVQLSADIDGFDPGTPARITIYERDLEGSDDEIEVIETEVKGKKVQAEWEYRYVEEDEPSEAEAGRGYSHPEYYFIVEVGGAKARSGLLLFQDWIEVELTDEDEQAIANQEMRCVLSSGEIRTAKADGSGRARFENVPPGKFRLEFAGYESKGARR